MCRWWHTYLPPSKVLYFILNKSFFSTNVQREAFSTIMECHHFDLDQRLPSTHRIGLRMDKMLLCLCHCKNVVHCKILARLVRNLELLKTSRHLNFAQHNMDSSVRLTLLFLALVALVVLFFMCIGVTSSILVGLVHVSDPVMQHGKELRDRQCGVHKQKKKEKEKKRSTVWSDRSAAS